MAQGAPVQSPTVGQTHGDDRLFTGAYGWILATNFFAVFNLNLYLLLPTFIRTVGGTAATIGLVMGTHSTVALIARFWIGGMLDRYGRRRFILIGCALSLVSTIGYFFVHTAGPLLFFCRALHGVGFACYFTAMITLTGDSVPPSRRTQALAWTGVAGFAANALAPNIGEHLLAISNVDTDVFGAYRVLFFFSLGIILMALALGTRTIAVPHEGAGRKPSGVFKALRRRELQIVLIPTIAMGLGFSSSFMFIDDWANQRGIDLVGPFFLTYSICVVCLRVFGGRMLDRVNRNAVIFPSLAVLACGVFLQTQLHESWWLIVLGLFCGTGHGLLYPTLSVMAYETVPPHERGAAMAVSTIGFDAGLVLGTVPLGFIARECGYETMYLTGGGLTVLGLVLYAWLAPPGGRFPSQIAEPEPAAAS